MPSQVVTRIRTDQWQILKDVRLRALEDAPYAFSTTRWQKAKKELIETGRIWRETMLLCRIAPTSWLMWGIIPVVWRVVIAGHQT